METKSVRFWLLILTVIVLFALPSIALAKGLLQDAPPVTTESTPGAVVLDVAFLIAITGFLKNLLNATGKQIYALAFGVGVVLWGEPLIASAFPAVGVYLDSFLAFIKVWLGAMGGYDVVTDVGSKIAAITPKQIASPSVSAETVG